MHRYESCFQAWSQSRNPFGNKTYLSSTINVEQCEVISTSPGPWGTTASATAPSSHSSSPAPPSSLSPAPTQAPAQVLAPRPVPGVPRPVQVDINGYRVRFVAGPESKVFRCSCDATCSTKALKRHLEGKEAPSSSARAPCSGIKNQVSHLARISQWVMRRNDHDSHFKTVGVPVASSSASAAASSSS
ncbi:hypothetical protein B0O80DRAFT_504673 [Mortierella sp. GBAus27b]|nr:hypothetical protein B0O80DRAFT_504673 [Mortierella sp. GBAus27b]